MKKALQACLVEKNSARRSLRPLNVIGCGLSFLEDGCRNDSSRRKLVVEQKGERGATRLKEVGEEELSLKKRER